MSLFKNRILDNYNLLQYKNDFLLLHCSRNNIIKAPFDGMVKPTEDGCILYNDYFKLHISHMQCDECKEVFAGQAIGTPKMGRILGENKAYIGVKLTYMDSARDVSVYLSYKDEDVYIMKEDDKTNETEEEQNEEVEIREISKPKRKSNKKKK